MFDLARDVFTAMRVEAVAGGNGVVVAALVTLIVLLLLISRAGLSCWGRMFVRGGLLIASGLLIRLGQWLAAQLWRLDAGDLYHPLVWSVREPFTVLASLLVSCGIMLCVGGALRRGTAAAWLLSGAVWFYTFWVLTTYPLWLRWQ